MTDTSRVALGHDVEDRGGMSMPYMGMVLFIASEIMFFSALFGAYFNVRAAHLGHWPPRGIPEIGLALPLLLTITLLSSSVSIHGAVWAIRNDNRTVFITSMAVTVLLGVLFLTGEIYDAVNAGFGISENIYGTTFFTLLGFHGLHVTGGVIFLSVILSGAINGRFSSENHQVVECASIYWHFVDIVWIGLFSVLYLLK